MPRRPAYVPKHARPADVPVAAQPGDKAAAITKNTLAMTVGTLLSRATGLARTWVLAFAFGNTVLNSAYQVANTMPNIVYDLVAGGIIAAAFVPMFLRVQARAGKAASDVFGSNLLNIVIILLALVSLLAMIFAPQVIYTQAFTQSTDSQVFNQAVFFFQLFAFQMLFYGISSVIACILNAKRVFFVTSWAPALNNLVVIASFLAYIPLAHAGMYTAAELTVGIGTTAGVAVQFLIQIPALVKSGFHYHFTLDLKSKDFHEVLKTGVPTVLFVLGTFVVLSFRNAFALSVGVEGPSAVSYAWVWFQLPYGLLGISISKVLFTEMSEAAAHDDQAGLKNYIKRGLSLTLLFIIPIAGLLSALSVPVISLFNIGNFTTADVYYVAGLMAVWMLALPFYAVQFYFYRAFAAIRHFGLYCVIRTAFCVLQCGLYALLCRPGGVGIIGIAIGDIIYYALTSIILALVLRRQIGSYGLGYVLTTGLKILVATLVGAGVAFLLHHFLPFGTTVWLGLAEVIVYGLIGLAVIVLFLRLLRVHDLKTFVEQIKRLLKRR